MDILARPLPLLCGLRYERKGTADLALINLGHLGAKNEPYQNLNGTHHRLSSSKHIRR